MPRPISAHIHTSALAHNFAHCQQAASGAKVWAVIKANAYGHGIERVLNSLRGADGFAVLNLDEAQRVRDLGWRGAILLIEGVFTPRDLECCSRLHLWHVVHHDAQIDMLASHKTVQPHHVFLKINTGMNRLGFAPERAKSVFARLQALPQVGDVGLMTHFACADSEHPSVGQAWQLFNTTTADLTGMRSVCNSAALLRQPDIASQTDWVRPGVALYGSSPDASEHDIAYWGLQPAMSLRAQVLATHRLSAGATVGYGATFTAPHDMAIATVACGYADGYPRTCHTGTPVLIDGYRSRTLGRVSMDMLAVDITPSSTQIPPQHTVTMGSEVTLWGQSSRGAVLSIDEVAAHAGTLGYELMCALAARVPVQVGA